MGPPSLCVWGGVRREGGPQARPHPRDPALCCLYAEVTPTFALVGGPRGSSGAQGCGNTGEAPGRPGLGPGLRPDFRKPSCPLSPRLISKSVPSGLLFPVRFLCEGGLGKFALGFSP